MVYLLFVSSQEFFNYYTTDGCCKCKPENYLFDTVNDK